MKTSQLLLAALACTWAMGAAAQWQWIDKDGRKVYSDRPPPAEIPQKSILKQPGGNAISARPVAVPPAADGASAAMAAASAPRPTGKDKELEERKAQADAAEAAKKKADEERQAKLRAENCERARQSKAAMTSGQLFSQTNAQGERVFMDESAKAAEARRADSVIASECAPR
ncbi:DUF4124 domain-containing protein [Acidovorax sp. SUPP2539]|uniref:DUF4124 domain-containing protein n=1 Tax=Acidovorax sp. SUPP2539 TaxID=2920878 RepID=UPI0023DE412A|nr:DUF4124 domain-containing protein [Acidovorax sp. SUPP2539]GKS90938.1 DUF4124 domain-containing protein [Acidovorax sp. SUPP2539]